MIYQFREVNTGTLFDVDENKAPVLAMAPLIEVSSQFAHVGPDVYAYAADLATEYADRPQIELVGVHWQCPSCKDEYVADVDALMNMNEIVEDGHTTYLQWGNIIEADVCLGCYESAESHGSTLVAYFSKDDTDEDYGGTFKTAVHFNEINAYQDYGDTIDDPEDWFWEVFDGKRKYVKTDAWRGYYDTKLKGLETIRDTWVPTTGYDPSVGKKDLFDLQAALKEGLRPPVTMYLLFEPTSNVFSMGYTLLARPDDVETLTTWLREQGVEL